jgi:murein DD-endopeptidase MepM/ murein hydrolase activator NlpD
MRHHPILHKLRFHRGIDFAAPIGTPVKAPANSTVKFFGDKGGYGKTIILQHDDHHDTLYAHLLNYVDDLFVGELIQKGQVIGYVGQSGLSTGPHLHFELHIDGVYQNPLPATTLPPGTLIVDDDLPQQEKSNESPIDKAHFLKQTRDLIARLDAVNRNGTQVASISKNQTNKSKVIQ